MNKPIYINYNGECHTVREWAELLDIHYSTILKRVNKGLTAAECLRAERVGSRGNYKTFTLCWSCAKACGGCSWSREFKPIDGWDAIPTKIRIPDDDGGARYCDSFKITACPQYVADSKEGGMERL